MKTAFSVLALALVASISTVAAAAPSTTALAHPDFASVAVSGGDSLHLNPGARLRSEVIAETKAAHQEFNFVDGSEYEIAHTMFMSQLTTAMVRADAVAAARTSDRTYAQ